jgi:hypothetical protein
MIIEPGALKFVRSFAHYAGRNPFTMKVLRICLFLSIIVVLFSSANAAEKLDQFAAAYAGAKTEAQKRLVCIEAIDAGVVRGGVSIDVLKRVFGPDFEDFGMDSRSNRLAMVNFVAPWRSTNALVSDVYRGWYLAVSYMADGAVLTYHLSNLGKESAMVVPSERKADRNQDIGLPIPSVDSDESKKKK